MLVVTSLAKVLHIPERYLAKKVGGTWIYVLFDPRDGEVRYIGQTINAGTREQSHRAKRTSSMLVESWKMNLAKNGLRPLMLILCRVKRSCTAAAERHAIRVCLEAGARLFNWSGNPSAEWRSKRGTGFGPSRARPTNEYKRFLRNYHPMAYAKLFDREPTKPPIVNKPARTDTPPTSRLPLLYKGHRLPYPLRPRVEEDDLLFGQMPTSYVEAPSECQFCNAGGTLHDAEAKSDDTTDGQVQDYENGFRVFLRCSSCGQAFWLTEGGQAFSISRVPS